MELLLTENPHKAYIKQKNGVKGIRESDAIYYIVNWCDIYDPGGRVNLNGRSLYISAIETELESGELYHTITLRPNPAPECRKPIISRQSAHRFMPVFWPLRRMLYK